MKKWDVYGVVSGSKYLGTVRAETEEDAIEEAYNQLDLDVSLCHQCSCEVDGAEIIEVIVEE